MSPTLIDEPGRTGAVNKGSGPDGVTAGGDLPSAKQVIRDACQSSAGKVRLATQTGTAHEVAALALLAGSAVALGELDAAIVNTGVGSALTGVSTWGDAVTAIAAS